MRKNKMTKRLVVVLLLILCGCSKPPSQTGLFTDITDQSNLKFVHDPGVDGTYFMPESLGSGAALFDYNNDGLLDIYLVNAGPHNKPNTSVKDRLFEQQKDGKFLDVTDKAHLGDTGYGLGAGAS